MSARDGPEEHDRDGPEERDRDGPEERHPDGRDSPRSHSTGRVVGGPGLLAALFAFVVGFTAVVGALLGAYADPTPPQLFFIVELPATPVGVATFGAVTVATLLVLVGAALALTGRVADSAEG